MSTSSKNRIATVVLIVLALVLAYILVPRPDYFQVEEYEQKSAITSREAAYATSPEVKAEETITQGTKVTMTGLLYGERGEVNQLKAEVILNNNGSVGWIPLSALL